MKSFTLTELAKAFDIDIPDLTRGGVFDLSGRDEIRDTTVLVDSNTPAFQPDAA